MKTKDLENTDTKYYELAAKLLNGTISPEEEKELSAWYDSHHDSVQIPGTFAKDEFELKNRMLEDIRLRMNQEKPVTSTRAIFTRVAAAVVVIAIGITAFFVVRSSSREPVSINNTEVTTPGSIVKTGSNRAELILADGSKIVLDDAADGVLTNLGTTKVIKLKSGQLSYQGEAGNGQDKTMGFNTISTPRGGQYEIILPDNTKVWLNATSSLKFPTVFSGSERHVQLTGEAYFEVEKNKAMPFKVTVNEMEIEVLGTHFNIMAYNDEQEIKTTLLEGSVKVTQRSQKALLKPGEQARIKKDDGTLKVSRNVNTEEAIAWKNGEFRFDNASVESIMAQVARWYDVSVTYKGDSRASGFTGIIPRTKNVSQVLEILEAAHSLSYQVNGNKIIVSPYKGK